MRKKIILTATVLALLSASIIEIESRFYPQTMIVHEIHTNEDLVTLSTGTGLLYQYSGIEDAEIGDLEAVIMFDFGKKGTVTDDIIVKRRYAGYVDLFQN